MAQVLGVGHHLLYTPRAQFNGRAEQALCKSDPVHFVYEHFHSQQSPIKFILIIDNVRSMILESIWV